MELEMKQLKFDPEHVESLLYGKKCITARLDLERDIQEGTHLELITPDGAVFGEAIVDRRADISIANFVDARLDGHRTYSSVGHMINELERYYPQKRNKIRSTNRLDVLWLRNIEEAGLKKYE